MTLSCILHKIYKFDDGPKRSKALRSYKQAEEFAQQNDVEPEPFGTA